MSQEKVDLLTQAEHDLTKSKVSNQIYLTYRQRLNTNRFDMKEEFKTKHLECDELSKQLENLKVS